MKRQYEQVYRAEWETVDDFKSWLCRDKNGKNAFCKACNCSLLSRMASIKQHSEASKHRNNLKYYSGSSKIAKYFTKNSIGEEARKAELKICAALVEHNIPLRVMDHLSEVFKNCFHDSEIAKEFSCKRTKSAELVYTTLAPEFQKDLIAEIKGELSSAGTN